MKRTLTKLNATDFPPVFHKFLEKAKIYDSSSSPEARVVFIDKDDGYYLKSAPKGTLFHEAEMIRYFYGKGISCRPLEYISSERDYLLTEKVMGEDCTYSVYLDEPKRLCDTIAILLRELHETVYTDCPIQNRTAEYLAFAEHNRKSGIFDTSVFLGDVKYQSADDAWKFIEANKHILKTDTLIHGDYCLPNIMLNDWKFSGFIDVGNGGVGDKHIDLLWGAWTLKYNLKTDKYCERFFDAYGKSDIDMQALRLIAAIECFG